MAVRGRKNGIPLSFADDTGGLGAAMRADFSDVGRACTKWLLKHDRAFFLSHEYFRKSGFGSNPTRFGKGESIPKNLGLLVRAVRAKTPMEAAERPPAKPPVVWVKECPRCLDTLPPTEFYRDPKSCDGREGICKSCGKKPSRKKIYG